MWNTRKPGSARTLAAVESARQRLPPGWTAKLGPGSRDADGVLTLRDAGGRRARLTVLACKRVSPKDLLHLVSQVRDASRLLLIAPFLSGRTRELLVGANASYADATGNLRIVVSDPAIFLEARGADRDPDREPRALRSLKSAAVVRVVRELCDFMPP